MSSGPIAEREFLYRLIIGQLLYDGLEVPALLLGNSVGIEINRVPPSPQLLYATRSYKKASSSLRKPTLLNSVVDSISVSDHPDVTMKKSAGLDFESEFEGINSPSLSEYDSQYSTAHKGPCTCAAFSYDGRLLATGSQDTSIKIIEVERILLRSSDSKNDKNTSKGNNDDCVPPKNHPVVRTLYDHTATVTCLEFHPSSPMLASGGSDHVINFFDYSKASAKKAFRNLTEVEVINSISFHPSGDYLLVAVEHSTLRLYDVNTQSCYVSSNPFDQHLGPINMVKYDPTGKLYVSSSNDGSFKLWDGISNRCVNTFKFCHNAYEVISAVFSSSGRYVLSASVDRTCRLWDIRNGQVIQAYDGSTNSNPGRAPATFNQNEDYVIYLDDKGSQGCWNSRTGEKMSSIPHGGNSVIRWLSHSPHEPALVSCCDDNRIRFWHCGISA